MPTANAGHLGKNLAAKMIARRCELRGAVGSSFKRLANYLVNHQGNEQRVGEVKFSNVLSEDYDFALKEILITQERNTRARGDKTYHLLISFREGEMPQNDVLEQIEQRMCERIGLGEHQRLSVVHRDTDNLHVHVAINKIHPSRFTIREPYYDKKSLGQVCTELEREYGLEIDNHIPKKTVGQGSAATMERAGGVESLIGWIQRECLGSLNTAQSWSDLHEVFNLHGLEIKERGNGLVVTNGEISIKASSIAREFSKEALERKFGVFADQLGTKQHSVKQYEKKPVDSSVLWDAFKQDSERMRKETADMLQRQRLQRDSQIRFIRKSFDAQNFFIKLIPSPFVRRIMRAILGKLRDVQINRAKSEYSQKKAQHFSQTRRLAWPEWLKAQAARGNKDALQYLQKRRFRKEAGQILTGSAQGMTERQSISVTSKGTRLYRSAVRETRDAVQMTWADLSEDKIAEGLALARAKFTGPIEIHGPLEFKQKVRRVAAAKGMIHLLQEENSGRYFYHQPRKPNTFPPQPLSQHRLRVLSECHLAPGRIDTDATSLLPVDAQLDRRPAGPVRRHDHHPESISKYVNSRNTLRHKAKDIIEHMIFTPGDAGEMEFSGVRQVDGDSMLLLKKKERNIMFVLPASDEVVAQMKAVKIGTLVAVSGDGKVSLRKRRTRAH